MRMEIRGRSDDRPNGYPIIPCDGCGEVWHLVQSARWDDRQQMEGRARAITAGWTVPDEGPCYCVECSRVRTGAKP